MSALKNILVTGASSGIGRAVVEALLINEDYRIFLVSRSIDKLKNLFENKKEHVVFIEADLKLDESLDSVEQLVNVKLDGVVLAAGDLGYKPFQFISREEIQGIFDINFFSPFTLIQKLLKAKKIHKAASIILVSSVSARVGIAATFAYSCSKAAIDSGVKVLAAELAPRGIRVNAVSPGLVDTPLLEIASSETGQNIIETNKDKYPLGIGKPQQVADLIIYLVSSKSSWITGQSIVIDGGYLLNR